MLSTTESHAAAPKAGWARDEEELERLPRLEVMPNFRCRRLTTPNAVQVKRASERFAANIGYPRPLSSWAVCAPNTPITFNQSCESVVVEIPRDFANALQRPPAPQ